MKPRMMNRVIGGKLVTEAESEHVQLGAAREVLERAGAGRPSRVDEAGVVLRIMINS